MSAEINTRGGKLCEW